MSDTPQPLPVQPPPDLVDADLVPLLSEPFASGWAADAEAAAPAAARGRARLLERLSASRAASAAMVTSRLQQLAVSSPQPGVSTRLLYAAPRDRAPRAGEPLRARWIELQPGCPWQEPDAAVHREWLVLRGGVRIGDVALQLRDYHVVPSGQAAGAVVASAQGARLFLRESLLDAAPGDTAVTVRDAEAGWPDFAPGIRRRVLWQRNGQAALLYHAEAGAAVPHHNHGHDEECLMVQGELFLDDLLLQEGDYQLAPAGTGHRITETDTGVVIYAHGDLELQFVA